MKIRLIEDAEVRPGLKKKKGTIVSGLSQEKGQKLINTQKAELYKPKKKAEPKPSIIKK